MALIFNWQGFKSDISNVFSDMGDIRHTRDCGFCITCRDCECKK